jgi:DNA mismatch endonuclease (patch repair protein)
MPDNLTPAQRSYCMSRIKGKDTDLEVRVRSALHRKGLRFRKHVKELPGKPDIVFTKARVAVFVDGDFWHGYRFPTWENKVSDFWKKKISKNRERDAMNHRKLREIGWMVIRLWQHELKKDFDKSIVKIVSAVERARLNSVKEPFVAFPKDTKFRTS